MTFDLLSDQGLGSGSSQVAFKNLLVHSEAHDIWTPSTSGLNAPFRLIKKLLQLVCVTIYKSENTLFPWNSQIWSIPKHQIFFFFYSYLVFGNTDMKNDRFSSENRPASRPRFLRHYSCLCCCFLITQHCGTQTRHLVTAERNTLSPFCHNMLSSVSPYKKLPMKILESFPLFLKERRLSYGSGERQEMTGILCGLFQNKLVGPPCLPPDS